MERDAQSTGFSRMELHHRQSWAPTTYPECMHGSGVQNQAFAGRQPLVLYMELAQVVKLMQALNDNNFVVGQEPVWRSIGTRAEIVTLDHHEFSFRGPASETHRDFKCRNLPMPSMRLMLLFCRCSCVRFAQTFRLAMDVSILS